MLFPLFGINVEKIISISLSLEWYSAFIAIFLSTEKKFFEMDIWDLRSISQ